MSARVSSVRLRQPKLLHRLSDCLCLCLPLRHPHLFPHCQHPVCHFRLFPAFHSGPEAGRFPARPLLPGGWQFHLLHLPASYAHRPGRQPESTGHPVSPSVHPPHRFGGNAGAGAGRKVGHRPDPLWKTGTDAGGTAINYHLGESVHEQLALPAAVRTSRAAYLRP